MIFDYVVYGWIALAVFTFGLLFFVTAPFGRHTKRNWGPMINARLAWVIMELPSPLVFSYFFFTGATTPNKVTFVFWGVWMLHYFNRSIIYPLRQRDHSKQMPILIMFMAIFFNLINGFINGYYLGNHSDLYTQQWLMTLPFWIGLFLFFLGMGINIQSDNILLHLRQPGEKEYKIPKGGFFRWVSCPNLFGEIVEWTGFAIMVSALPAWAFAIWTFANLAPRAIAHHQWYLQKFDNYPKERKALIPFIW